MAVLQIIRLAVLGIVLLFSVIILGLSANLLNLTLSDVNGFFNFAALAVAIAVITILSLTPLIVIDRLRKGAFTSWIIVEVVWFGVLWVLWLATAADASADTVAQFFFGGNCNNFITNDGVTACRSYGAIQAFSYLNWLILMCYSFAILVLALISSSRGNPSVWTSTIRDTDFMAHKNGSPVVPMQQQPTGTGYPPQSGTPASVASPEGSYAHGYNTSHTFQNAPVQGAPHGGQSPYPQV